VSRCDVGEARDRVIRSLITLKALTYAPTGGMVAAPTTSLPESPGGWRNWDYRYCWVRDATFTFYALLAAGLREDAARWRDWLVRAVAGDPGHMPVVYRVDGARLLDETEIPWLPGFEGSRPVRIGNAARAQLQLDVFGELVDSMFLARCTGIRADTHGWDLQRNLLDYFESEWAEPDEGIWEMRADARHYTHSKVMAWVAFDRAIRTVEEFGLDGPVDRWRKLRGQIHEEVCDRAWDPDRATFTQSYGSKQLDASLLRIPLVGFLPVTDERVQSTMRVITTELDDGGLLRRYGGGSDPDDDSDEGAFLACSFWLADGLALLGREDDARAVHDRVAGLANDVGLLSEEYDPTAGRMLGNFPQALTHVSLVNSAINLVRAGEGPAHHRARR
jgi:GH15 family glucan-1,4-alpha-glucosidase